MRDFRSGLLFIFSGLLLTTCHFTQPAHDQVCFKGKCVNVELAQSPSEVEKGLKFRDKLDEDSGMLFIFSKSGQHSFWMKDTVIALDMIWMDYARRVVHIEQNVPPCVIDPCPTYGPKAHALYVLEVNANHSKAIGLKLGDELEFRLKDEND